MKFPGRSVPTVRPRSLRADDPLCDLGERIAHRDWLFDPGEVPRLGDDAPDHVVCLEAFGLPQLLRNDAIGRAADDECR
ncbi:hypothetical protein MSHO_42640 [Mycobacterium shottsii]|uniref:Uncharacterized protein n=1 Tax=Mycobacterium shottsii TaxID=133549 RepID=A0A7I7LHR5_9MYCO|nr:hypothetical protein MSHO_42640 [Mycobacterium shottsii]